MTFNKDRTHNKLVLIVSVQSIAHLHSHSMQLTIIIITDPRCDVCRYESQPMERPLENLTDRFSRSITQFNSINQLQTTTDP